MMNAVVVPVGHVSRFTALAADALARGITVTFRAHGDSMRPAIRDGDMIVVAPASADDLRIGDVLLCRCDSRLLAHRLIGVSDRADGNRWLCLRGDANGSRDAPVRAADVLGRVESVRRSGSTTRVDLRAAAARARRWFSVIIPPG